ncbi:MAG TPA: hypothetical protein PKI02_13560 [Mycobacterium sp.]|nr:hypothetical protein [Mycobacterium sp.]HNM12477.1 hypothetical protein [Mycobacterium sp.]HNM94708.1 hypothetical protein [Mycobacterium sp.]HNP14304.1 hypothetical protein [Mycobacterium sp.]
MAPDNEPWYRSSAATLAAGLIGLALVAGLVIAVVQMSSRWDTTTSDIVVPPGTHVPEAPHVMATTPTSSTSYTTSVRLSTTDIGLPLEVPSSTTTTSSGSESPIPSIVTPTSTNAVAPTFPGSFPSRVTHPPGPRQAPGRPSR